VNTTKQIKINKPNKLSAFFICIIIATILWLLHSLNTVYTKQFAIPVEFINYPHHKMMINEAPKELSVSVKASGLKLFLIGLNEPFSALQVDFNDTKSNQSRNRFYLSSNIGNIQKLLKLKADIKSVYPDTIAFINSAGTQKEVAVKVPLFIKYAQGYVATSVKIEPNKVLINGEEADIQNIDTLYTSPIYLNNLKSNFSKNVSISNSNSRIVLNKNTVELTISIDKLIEREVTLNLHIENEEPTFKYVLFPSKVKLKLTTSFNKLSDIDTTILKANVNLKQKKNNKLPVNLSSMPSGINIIDYYPKEVEFLIIKKK